MMRFLINYLKKNTSSTFVPSTRPEPTVLFKGYTFYIYRMISDNKHQDHGCVNELILGLLRFLRASMYVTLRLGAYNFQTFRVRNAF